MEIEIRPEPSDAERAAILAALAAAADDEREPPVEQVVDAADP